MKRALLIGVDEYTNFPTLTGCVSDVLALEPLLSQDEDGSPNFDCQVNASVDVTERDELIEALRSLFAPGADIALLYFAGHGAEIDGDVVICSTDGTTSSPGIPLAQVLGFVQSSSVGEVILLLDCCFSGAAGGVPQLGLSTAAIRDGVSILAASRPEQTAAEAPTGRGAFSTYLCGALGGGAADVVGKVTLAGIYAYLSESFGAWDQRPTFKSNVDRLHEIRRCRPAVPLQELRQLPEIFPSADEQVSLDPSYEPTEEPKDDEHEAVFAILQRCRAAKLVEPVGHDHMYYAALYGLSCRLTQLGKHYWRLAEQGRL